MTACSALAAAKWRSAVGWALLVVACVVCLGLGWFQAGWVHAGQKGDLWGGPLLPWGVGLVLAVVVAWFAPHAWVDRQFAPRTRGATTLAILVVFVLVEFAMAWLGYVVFRLHSDDIRLFVDLVQQTLGGHLLQLTTGYGRTESYLAQHWAFQSLLWLPAWMAWPDPRVLLLIQIVGYVAMAAAVHRLAMIRLGPGPWPLAITTAVLLVPSKDWALSQELGNAPFLALLIVVAVLCVHRDRPAAFVAILIVIAMSREDASVLAAVLAMYAWWIAGWRRLGAAAVVVSGMWLVVLLKVIMPSFVTFHRFEPLWTLYSWLGDSSTVRADPVDAARRVLTHLLDVPVPAVVQLFASFGVVAFVSSAAWGLLLGFLPTFLTNTYPAGLIYHHAYPAIAVAAVAAIEGARRLDSHLSSHPRVRLGVVLAAPLAALSLHAVFGYSPLTRSFAWSEYWPTLHTRALWATLGMVPSNASLAGDRLLAIHRFVGRPPGCTYVSLSSAAGTPELWCGDTWRAPLADSFLLIDRPRPTPELQYLLTDSPYGLVRYQQDIALFQRGAGRSANRALARWIFGEVRDAMSLPRQIGSVLGDAASRPGRAVRAPRGQAGFVLYGWYVWTCSAPHELVVRLRGDSRWRSGSIGRVEIVANQGARVLATGSIDELALARSDYRELVVTASPPEAGLIEARVYSTGNAAFWVDSMALVGVTPSGAFRFPGDPCEGPRLDSFSPSLPAAPAPQVAERARAPSVTEDVASRAPPWPRSTRNYPATEASSVSSIGLPGLRTSVPGPDPGVTP